VITRAILLILFLLINAPLSTHAIAHALTGVRSVSRR
jgi:multisubunit Na+/H+ antiporter MnhG subunit